MKLIKITQQNKADNPVLFKNNAVDSYRRFNTLPNAYIGVEKVDGGYAYRTDLHEQDGFLDFVQRNPDESIEKLGDIILDGNTYTNETIPLTAQEQADYIVQQEDNVAQTEESSRQSDGDAEARYIFKNLRRLLNKGVITENQFKASQNLLFDALLPITYGLWDVSETRLNNLTNPSNATLLNVLNQIRVRITYYVNNGERSAE